MSNNKKSFGTLRDRVHLYVFIVTSLILCFQIVQTSAYATLELTKAHPEIAYTSDIINLGASFTF